MESIKKSDAIETAVETNPAVVLLDPDGHNNREFQPDSLEVIKWSEYFQRRAESLAPFGSINECLKIKSKKTATIVGANWLSFSKWLPAFLTLSAARVEDNLVRHYLIQIAYEELGCRKSDEIHSRLFAEALTQIGISESDISSASNKPQRGVYNNFYDSLVKAETTAEILGLNLGIEIIAEENIETLFSLLAYSPDAVEILNESLYFRMHRAIEEGHLRLSISNFLRFCHGERDKTSFANGFDKSLRFWKTFWHGNSLIISSTN